MDYREELIKQLDRQAMMCLGRFLGFGIFAVLVAAGFIPPVLLGAALAAYAAVSIVNCFVNAQQRNEVEGKGPLWRF